MGSEVLVHQVAWLSAHPASTTLYPHLLAGPLHLPVHGWWAGCRRLETLGPERGTEASWAIAVGAVLRAALLERPGGRREAESPVEQGLGRWGQVVAQVT